MSRAEAGGRAGTDGERMATAPVARVLAPIVVGGFAARAAVALSSENILWPDEVFQYLEQGHRAVFGYGYLPWEFRYAARSWLLPGFVAVWLWLCQAVHLDTPTVYVPFVKLVFCALSTTLILSAYRAARNLAGEGAGLLAALLTAGWYELIYVAHKPLTEVVATYALIGGLAFATEPRPTPAHAWYSGFLAGLVAALRIQYLPGVAIVALYGWVRWPRHAWSRAAAGCAVAVLLAGALDRVTWGGWFETYRVSYRLNSVLHVSDWFGVEPGFWYVGALLATSTGLLWVPLGLGWVRRLSGSRLPVMCAAALIAAHSLVAHKEYRFIIAVVPLAWLTAAMLLARARAERRLGKTATVALLALFFGVSVLGLTYRLPGLARVYPAGPLLARWPSLDAYLRLSADPGVRGLLSSEDPRFRPPVVGTGGYYYLHHDVPVYFPSELRAAALPRAQYAEVATHLLEPATVPPPAGFTAVAAFGTLEIRSRPAGSDALRTVCLPLTTADAYIDHALAGLPVHRARDPQCR